MRLILGLLSLGVLLVIPPHTVGQKPEIVREEFHQTYPLSSNGRISLENIQGKVRIQAWDRNEVKVDAVKSAYSHERLNEAQIKVVATSDTIRIRTEYPDGNLTFNGDRDGDYRSYQNPASVDYTLSVPRNSRLSSIELVNGGLDIDGVAGDVHASCVNGKMTVKSLRGDVKLGTVNGALEATFDAFNESKSISLGSVNGNVTLIVPSDSNAIVKAGTVHGAINNDFGLPVRQGDYVGRQLYGQIGNGGAFIKLGNVNGSVNIRHASDGRTLSPARSLVNAGDVAGKGKEKGKAKDKVDSDDWDFDWDQGDDDNQRAAQRAARDAQREVARAEREVVRAQAEAQRVQAAAVVAERKAQREVAETAREDQREVEREARETQREVARTASEVTRAATEASRAALASADSILQVFSDGNYRLVERDTARFDVGNAPQVSVETFDGAVAVHGWDKPEVLVNIVKRAASENAMRGIRFNAVKDGNQIKIVASFDKAFADRPAPGIANVRASVNLQIYVPRGVILRASSGDGYLALDGVYGQADLVTSDGSIDVVDGRGRILAMTSDGRIRIVKFDGAAEATTGDGRITLEGRFAQLTARTGDGSITLVLPSDFDAIIETDAERLINESDLVIVESPTTSKNVRRWKVGKGGTVLNLHTGDGRIILRRASEQ